MLYMQEVEKLEGYGQESYQAKVSIVRCSHQHDIVTHWKQPNIVLIVLK